MPSETSAPVHRVRTTLQRLKARLRGFRPGYRRALTLIALAAGGAVLAWAGLRTFRPAPALPAGETPVLKLLVSEPGLYGVSAADLRRFGWEGTTPDSLRLERGGEPAPFHIDPAGAGGWRMIFYGEPPPEPFDRYTGTNVYWLSIAGEPGPRYAARTPGAPPELAPERVEAAIDLEENEVYAPRFVAGRAWFWAQLAAPGTLSVPFTIPTLAPGPTALVIDWVGTTQSDAVDPDHHLAFRINGAPAGDERWDGSGPITFRIDLLDGALVTGENILEIEAVGDTGVPADIGLLDRVRVEFTRPAAPQEGRLAFTAEAEGLLVLLPDREIGAFLLDRTDGAVTTLQTTGPTLVSTLPGHEYVFATSDGLRAPDAVEAYAPGEDLRSVDGADYLAIGDPVLLAALEPLLEARRSQGLSTRTVPLAHVYDQFGAGLAAPHAIRSFLRHAAENWLAAPRYVLLVGDWSYDPLGHTSEPVENGLPSFFVFTEYGGETVSDVLFAKLDEDDLPDLALGRFPARTAGQVRTLVEKTLAYEAALDGSWTRRILAVADSSERIFTGDAENFLDGFPGVFEPVMIAPQPGEAGVNETIRAEIDAGVMLFAYFGHGSIAQLGKDRLFTTADAAALANGAQAPVMLNITCLAGLFTHPTVDSLSEVMLWGGEGGGVASLSATSLTLPVFQAFLSEAFVERWIAADGGRLGDVMLAAQRAMPLEYGTGALEVLDTFLLFGDPALPVPGP